MATLHEAIEESLRLEDDIIEAREERYKVGEKRKGEGSIEAARSTKSNQEGKRGEPRSEKKWCKKCHYKYNGPCRRGTQPNPTKCGNCGRPGHSTQDCYSKGVICYECKEPGHFRSGCPKLKAGPTGASNRSVVKKDNPPKAPSRAFQMSVEEARETADVV